MSDSVDSQDAWRDAAARIREITKEIGHLPVLADTRLAKALEPLLYEHETIHGNVWRREKPQWWPKSREDRADEAWSSAEARVAISADLYFRASENTRYAVIEMDVGLEPGQVHPHDVGGEERRLWTSELEQLRRFLDERRPRDVEDGSLLWEIHAAGTARHSSRLVALCQQLVARRPDHDGLTLAARAVFLAFSDLEAHLGTELWIPQWCVDGTVRASWEKLVGLAAAVQCSRELTSHLHRSAVRRQDRDRAEAALMVWQWLEWARAIGPLSPEQKLIRAWAGYEQGRSGNAEHLISCGEVFEKAATTSTEPEIRDRFFAAAASCYLAHGQGDRAERPLRARLQCARDSAAATLNLAQCYYLQNKMDAALSAMQQFESLNGPGSETEEFMTSLILGFGAEADRVMNLERRLVAAAMASPRRRHGEAIASWLDASFPKVGEAARGRWWSALHMLSSDENARMLGEERWRYVAVDFAEALNCELRRCVFEPFTAGHSDLIREVLTGPPSPLQRVFSLTGTLAENLKVLSAATSEETALSRALRQWLQLKAPKFLEFIELSVGRLKDLANLRNMAAHGAVGKAQARRVFRTAQLALRALYWKPGTQ